MKKERDYTYDKAYNARPIQKERRAERNAARAKMEKAGLVHKGQDVDHISRNKGGHLSNAMSNLRAQTPSKNRSRNQ